MACVGLEIHTWALDLTGDLRAKSWDLLVTCKTKTLSHLWYRTSGSWCIYTLFFCIRVQAHMSNYFRATLLTVSTRDTPCMIGFTRINSHCLYQHARYEGIFMCQLPVAASVSITRRWLVRCVCPTHRHTGWIRRKWWQENNSGRLSGFGMVHFSPEAEGGPFVTLMDRNAAHPHAHTHTPTHVPHAQSLAQQLARYCSHMMDTYTHTTTHRLLCPTRSDIQCEMFTTRPHGLPPLSINSSQKYVWCIIM